MNLNKRIVLNSSNYDTIYEYFMNLKWNFLHITEFPTQSIKFFSRNVFRLLAYTRTCKSAYT